MRVLITGADGQVGRELTAACADDDTTAAGHAALDVSDRGTVLAAVTTTRPEVILHAGAWTAVDACEGDPDRAFAVNALGTRHVAEAARRVGAHLVYFSTDYVFDGTQAEPYREWDTPNPQSVYGRSKLGGERELAATDATIVRLSWVCGDHGANMVKTVLRLAAAHDELSFVDDQRGHPTFAGDVGPLVRRLAADRRPGLFHVTNQGVVSWYEFARAVLAAADLDPARVRPIRTADLDPPRPAPRPANSVLDNAALRLEGNPLLRDFHEPLAELVRRLRVVTPAPSVRAIVVNYNGGAMTLDCLQALSATDWPQPALQIVLVDNGSDDGIADRVGRELPHVATVRSATNLGFAGGANLGMRDVPEDLDYVALLNSDTTVGPTWLSPLVAALERDAGCGAACPKLLLADQYEAVHLSGTPGPRSALDRRPVTVRVIGARIDGTDVLRRVRFGEGFLGPEFAPRGAGPFQWASGEARLLLPGAPAGARRELRLAAARPQQVQVQTTAATSTIDVGVRPSWVSVPARGETFDVINNVGTDVRPDGYAADRGYLERDVGQRDQPVDVDAWCGGAVVLPASYTRSVGPFDERLFAYYEDVDLSLRGRRAGWRYVTVPESTVRHIHMATSSARAPVALYYNERNRLVVFGRHASRPRTAGELLRFLAVTLSYFRRDVVAAWCRGQRPAWTITAARLHALVGACRLGLGRTGRRPARGSIP